MDLHACECGSSGFDRQHRLEMRGDDLVAVYEGACRQCGRVRHFEFQMAEEIPPPAPVFGGAEPSRIIDPGEFVQVAYRISRSAGLQLLNTPASEHHKYRAAMAYALAAFEEVLKFIPPGQDAIPEDAFTSEVGKARYRKGPRSFERELIQADIDLARQVLGNIDKVALRATEPTQPPGAQEPPTP
uniref:HEPN domain-containing protein n=1 Tax=Streptomyces sp. NBC_00049 TaxID=2903617 RepID=A0AAU2JR85_9ACTN